MLSNSPCQAQRTGEPDGLHHRLRGSYPGLIPRDRLEHLLEVFTTNYAAPGFVADERLPRHEEVAGLSLNGVDRAYPLSVLRDRGILNDHVGERSIAITYDAETDHVIALDRLIGDKAIDLIPAPGRYVLI